ncbi:MAG: hypothetical protein NT103_02760 [Campylobacterales bacterium]|nr:hypothetical protein [Campylobacterales bacterium]
MCSRKDKLHFYSQHFDAGGEIVCQDANSNPLLISQTKRWERKGRYLNKKDSKRGYCESGISEEQICTYRKKYPESASKKKIPEINHEDDNDQSS